MNSPIFDSVWIDMDETLMNWSKGNVEKALRDIEDPNYYYTLEPMDEEIYIYLKRLRGMGKSLHVISGIPDPYHCSYVPYYKYRDYYNQVCKAKSYTISKYFMGLFDTIDYVGQGDSKASLIRSLYNPKDPVFIDDMPKYIDEWKSLINDKALLVGERSCKDHLVYLYNLC